VQIELDLRFSLRYGNSRRLTANFSSAAWRFTSSGSVKFVNLLGVGPQIREVGSFDRIEDFFCRACLSQKTAEALRTIVMQKRAAK
jgi:hypothetical protein